MERSIAMSWCAGLVLGLMAAPLAAQTTVQGAVIVQSGSDTPVADRARRVMGAQVVVVQRVQGRYGWWRGHGYRVITVYSDGERFYRRPFGRTVLRKVVVYERGGRYFINDGQWKWHRDYYDERYGRDGRRHNDHDSYSDRDDRDDRNGRDDGNSHGNGNDQGNGKDHHDNGNHNGWDKH